MSPGITGLISQYDLSLLDLGKSDIVQQGLPVYGIAFGATTLYKPELSAILKDGVRNFFVFWKTDDQPDHIPNWEDEGIPDQVRNAWRLNEARKLAFKEAGVLKDKAAAKPGKSLTELGSSFTVVKPLPFSYWINDYGQIEVGKVFGLDNPFDTGFKQKAFSLDKLSGPYSLESPFMQKVFSLGKDQVDVVANLPQTEIYVIRVEEFTPFSELWAEFTSEPEDWSIYSLFTRTANLQEMAGLRIMAADLQSKTSRAWLDRVYADAGLKWDKSAEQRSIPGAPAPSPSSPPGDDE